VRYPGNAHGFEAQILASNLPRLRCRGFRGGSIFYPVSEIVYMLARTVQAEPWVKRRYYVIVCRGQPETSVVILPVTANHLCLALNAYRHRRRIWRESTPPLFFISYELP
jgi:hypothetical protein